MNLGINRRIHLDVTRDLIARFWAKVDRRGDDECWPWLASTRSNYGAIKHRGKVYSAHCVAWILQHGRQIPEGMVACHSCDNPGCCNPAHLLIGSPKDNVDDMQSRQRRRNVRGEESPKAILTESTVLAIRALHTHGYGRVRIAKMLNLVGHEYTIDSILKGKSWRHLIGEQHG